MNGGRQRVESNVAGFSSRFLETTSNAFRGSRPNFSESESRREESFSLEISLYFSSFLFERLPPPLLPLDSRNGTEAHLHLADRLSRYSHASIKLRHNWILGRGGRQIYERCPPPSRIKILERSARRARKRPRRKMGRVDLATGRGRGEGGERARASEKPIGLIEAASNGSRRGVGSSSFGRLSTLIGCSPYRPWCHINISGQRSNPDFALLT